jgi:purine-nucleoside phosphorylase
MSIHIGARPGQVAPLVLMPGDPLRARWVAETFLDDAECYTEVRGMYGYTGTWRGHPVSVQGSGMGQPSLAIYVNELFAEYDVRSVIRVGSCGALTERVALRDVVIASGACTDSAMNRIAFEGIDYAPVADFGLLRAAVDAAEEVVISTGSIQRSTGSTTGVETAGDAALAHLDPGEDIHASADYRAHLVRVLTSRVLRAAYDRAVA